MGVCSSSKVQTPGAAESFVAKTVLEEPAGVKASQADGTLEVYGVPVSMNCMGPVLLVVASKGGKMVPCIPRQDTQTASFKAMNPFGAVPCLKDGDVTVAESSAILRYIAEKCAPEAYPKGNSKRRAFIDWALDRFATSMFEDATKTIYPCLGFASPPEDPAAVGKKCSENLAKFAEVFLKEKFVGGSKPSIADYKVAPWFFAYAHPMLKEKCSVELPDRIKQFNKDFATACGAHGMLEKADGFAIKEMLDSKYGSTTRLTDGPNVAYDSTDLLAKKKTAGKGKIEIHGIPVSMNCGGPVMLAREAKLGDLVHCMPGEGTRTPEFLGVNPFGSIPALKDGDFCLAESSAILRYLAESYAPEYYPAEAKARAKIDWAMDRFNSVIYKDAVDTIYFALGFRPMPEDTEQLLASGKLASEHLAEFATVFLKDKFVNGERTSIVDYKVAPFFAAFAHPLLKGKFGVEVPERIIEFNTDFAEACGAASMLKEAGGFAVLEMLDSKA